MNLWPQGFKVLVGAYGRVMHLRVIFPEHLSLASKLTMCYNPKC